MNGVLMAHDIAGLVSKINALHEAISKLRDAKHGEVLLPVVHRPGWTTVAEFELVHAHVAYLHNQVSHLHTAYDELVMIANKIGNNK